MEYLLSIFCFCRYAFEFVTECSDKISDKGDFRHKAQAYRNKL